MGIIPKTPKTGKILALAAICMQGAFLLDASAALGNRVVIQNQSIPIDAITNTRTHAIPVDETLEEVSIILSYEGDTSDLGFAVLRPDSANTDTGVSFDCEPIGDGTTSCVAVLERPRILAGGTGDYALKITNHAGIDTDVIATITANPKSGDTYIMNVSVGNETGNDVTYPAPVTISATLRKDTAITGLIVVADVFDSSGSRIDSIDLLDDGKDADPIEGDGTYTGVFHYSGDGFFTVTVNGDNSARTGKSTTTGQLGGGPAEETPITENFGRSVRTTVSVNGVRNDDHGDDPTRVCTMIHDDNIDVQGRIDRSGDIDCFAFTPSNTGKTGKPLVARATSQTGGMRSIVTVLASDGMRVLARADMSSSTNPQSGVIVQIPASSIDPSRMVITIAHEEATTGRGYYAVSAGPAIISDRGQGSWKNGQTTGDRPGENRRLYSLQDRGWYGPQGEYWNRISPD